MIARLLVGILTSLLQISLIASLTADEHVELAKRHLVAQRYTDALTEYDNAIQQDDTNYLYYFKRATSKNLAPFPIASDLIFSTQLF